MRFPWILMLLMTSGSTLHAELHFYAIPVGYGESYVLQEVDAGRAGWTVLIDAGTTENASSVIALLDRLKISNIHEIFLTHGHPNHIGALPKITQRYSVERLLWRGAGSEEEPVAPLLKDLKDKGCQIHTAIRGMNGIRTGKIKIDLLHPLRRHPNPHDGGLVLLITYGKLSFLFAGDATPQLQEQLWPMIQKKLSKHESALVLAAWPHHGDALASSWEEGFARVPWVVVGVGSNPYGLPRTERAPQLWKKAWRTDQHGSLELVSDGKKIQPR